MNLQKPKAKPTVAISISESPDMSVFGLSAEHLQNAMAEIALHLLSSGRSLAYGGDLRTHGFTELLFELITRYQDHPHHNDRITVSDYLAWPVHIKMTSKDLANFFAGHKDSTDLILLSQNGDRLAWEQRLTLSPYEPDDEEWTEGLTAMRTVMRRETQARIVLGGRVKDYKGRMPGIAEETLLSLQARQPVFLLGGFGGCARDIAETVGLVDRWAGSRPAWKGRSYFGGYSPSSLNNGLSDEDNAILAQTPHIQQAVLLVSRGLHQIFNKPANTKRAGESNAQGIH